MARKKKMKKLDMIAMWLLIVGGLNWGLVAWFGLDLVQVVSFGMSWLATVLYSLVGASAIYKVIRMFK